MTVLGNVLGFFGKNTIVLLALHVFFLTSIDNIINHFIFINTNSGVIFWGYGYLKIIAATIFCIAFSMILHYIKLHFLEKIALRKLYRPALSFLKLFLGKIMN
jgi:hypothetical protein